MKDLNRFPLATLHDLLDHEARQFTHAEVQLQHAIPGWIAQAASEKLKSVLEKYLGIVKLHIHHMDAFFEAEQISSLSNVNRVMEACITEIREKMAQCADTEVRDACLLAGIQSINHQKIHAYGTAAAFAGALGMEQTAGMFHEAEVNEKQIDVRLSQLAKFEVNQKARSPITL